MTDLSVSNALASKQTTLSDEEQSQRVRGVAAGTQLMVNIAKIAAAAQRGSDDDFDVSHAAAQEEVLRFLRGVADQPDQALRGFAYVLAEYVFWWQNGVGLSIDTWDDGKHHANPPLTPTAMCDLQEHAGAHNGTAVKPRQRAALARRWHKARERLNCPLPMAATEAEGRSRYVRLLGELRYINGNSEKRKASERVVDDAMRAAMSWPEPARRAFTEMAARYMTDLALGGARELDDEIEHFGTPEDKAHVAELVKQERDELGRNIARNEVRARRRKVAG